MYKSFFKKPEVLNANLLKNFNMGSVNFASQLVQTVVQNPVLLMLLTISTFAKLANADTGADCYFECILYGGGESECWMKCFVGHY